MGGRHWRHARKKTDWGGNPPRSTERGEAVTEDSAGLGEPTGRKPRGRKDTRRWCHGKAGVPHVPGLTIQPDAPNGLRCRWQARWIPRSDGDYGVIWWCWHRERCVNCERVLREGYELADEECPVYPGDELQRLAAEDDAERCSNLPRGRWRRRPPITGPQGYRRPKAGK